MMNNYVYCWQQGLSNGEIDGAVCDIGTCRWFDYLETIFMGVLEMYALVKRLSHCGHTASSQ